MPVLYGGDLNERKLDAEEEVSFPKESTYLPAPAGICPGHSPPPS